MRTDNNNSRVRTACGRVRKLSTYRAWAAWMLAGLMPVSPVIAMDASQLYAKRAPSIWLVTVYDAQGRPKGLGSAVVIGPETLVTNCHVLFHSKSVSVKHENTAHGARLEHADVDRDLCILRAQGMVAPAVPIAPLTSLLIGQKVYAIGAPRGMELTLSDGLLAAIHRDRSDAIASLQITAPISPGSSGGGIFDVEGRLVGVSSATLLGAQNVNFAIPAAWIDDVPARAKVALQKFRAEQAAPLVAAAPGATAPTRVAGVAITGDELSRHVAALGQITAIAPSGVALDFRFSPDGSFDVTNTRSKGYSSGRLTVAPDSNEVCFQMGNPRFIQMQTCYRLSRNGETYTMRSVSSSYFFTYALSAS